MSLSPREYHRGLSLGGLVAQQTLPTDGRRLTADVYLAATDCARDTVERLVDAEGCE